MTSPRKKTLFIAFLLTMLLMSLLYLHTKTHIVIIYLIALNCTTFIFYLYDKAIATKSFTRVPESTLHLLAIVGGSPAALLAQKLFRHKTAKSSFRIIYYSIVLGQITLIGYCIYTGIFFAK